MILKEDISRFDVSVDYLVLMQKEDGLCQLLEDYEVFHKTELVIVVVRIVGYLGEKISLLKARHYGSPANVVNSTLPNIEVILAYVMTSEIAVDHKKIMLVFMSRL